MISYREDFESIKQLIPLHVNGLLSDSEIEKIEKAIVAYPDLKDEADSWGAIKETYKDIECELPQPSNRVFSRITEKIRKPEPLSIFERFFLSRKFAISMIAVQMAIIVFLGVSLFNLKNEFNQTFVIVTHNRELAAMADKRYEMKDGRIIQ